jgi:hypothetical protein
MKRGLKPINLGCSFWPDCRTEYFGLAASGQSGFGAGCRTVDERFSIGWPDPSAGLFGPLHPSRRKSQTDEAR